MGKKIAEEVLQTIPYGSKEWTRQRRKLTSELEKKYPGQYVLCVPGKLEKPDLGIHQGTYQEWDVNAAHKMFGNDKHLFGKNVKFIKRSTAEYNLEYKQVNVFCCIEDNEGRVLLIRKNNGEHHFPGGHVDFGFDAYLTTPEQVLRSAIIQELEEELQMIKKADWALMVPEKPTAVINTETRWNDLFHLAVIYHVRLNCHIDDLKFTSGEPDKHSVVILRKDNVYNLNTKKKDYIHSWVHDFTSHNKIRLGYMTDVSFTSEEIKHMGGQVK